MSKKFVIMFVLLFIQNICQATIFFPLPLEKQVEEATSGAEVILSSSKVFKYPLGTIMTEYNFDVLESYNFSADDLENQKIKLTMPGGTFDGITSMIDGAPKFKKNEKSFLLLKKIESKIYLSNFSMGKFSIKEHEGKTYYVSEVFPKDLKSGTILKEDMIELMKTKWKTSFILTPDVIMYPEREVSHLKEAPRIFKNSHKRSPAQQENKSGVPLFFWSAMVIGAFFFFYIFFKLSKGGHQHKCE